MMKILKKDLVTEASKKAAEFSLECTEKDVLDLLEHNDIPFLSSIPIALSHNRADQDFVERICIKLSSHKNSFVRGNSILSFGHIVEFFDKIIYEKQVFDIVSKALTDQDDYVRGQAYTAAIDLNDFLGWHFNELSEDEME